MKITPKSDYVMIRRADKETTIGSIIIPSSAQEKQARGEVVAVGPGRYTQSGVRIVPDVQAGNVVLFNKYAGSEIQVDGETYVLLREDEIVGTLEP